jgi:hypothetical protein
MPQDNVYKPEIFFRALRIRQIASFTVRISQNLRRKIAIFELTTRQPGKEYPAHTTPPLVVIDLCKVVGLLILKEW